MYREFINGGGGRGGNSAMDHPALHTAGAPKISIDQSGFSWEKSILKYQVTFLTGDGIKYSQKGVTIPN